MRYAALAIVIGVVSVAMPRMAAAADPGDDGWHFDLTPYIWIPNIQVDLRYSDDLPPGGSSSADVQAGPNQLNGVFLLNAAARKGDWSVAADFIHLGYTTDSKITKVHGSDGDVALVPRTVDLGTRTEIGATLAQLALGRALTRGETGFTTAFAGVRYVHLDGRVHWDLSQDIAGTDFTFARSGVLDASASYVDGIVGLNGRHTLGEGKYFFAYYVDVGAGQSNLTWQANVGGGYAFNWGDLLVSYRYLDYDEGSDEFLQALKVDGPLIGVSFHF
jgi:hypothetical protein